MIYKNVVSISDVYVYVVYLVSAATFSVGMDWRYDERYKESNNYILARFSDLKSEIMEYKYIKNIMDVYKKNINKKAKEYHQTKLAKSIKRGSDIIPVSYLECTILYRLQRVIKRFFVNL